MNNFEKDLLNNKEQLMNINSLFLKHEFSEEFLIKTRLYYESWKCLRRQHNLSPYFCFYYLYDRQEYDSADDWTDYNQVYEYLKNKNYSDEVIKNAFNKAMNDRKINDD